MKRGCEEIKEWSYFTSLLQCGVSGITQGVVSTHLHGTGPHHDWGADLRLQHQEVVVRCSFWTSHPHTQTWPKCWSIAQRFFFHFLFSQPNYNALAMYCMRVCRLDQALVFVGVLRIGQATAQVECEHHLLWGKQKMLRGYPKTVVWRWYGFICNTVGEQWDNHGIAMGLPGYPPELELGNGRGWAFSTLINIQQEMTYNDL